MIVNDNSRVINNLEASLTDDARVVFYDHYMFIAQATAKVGTISPTKKTFLTKRSSLVRDSSRSC
jgi:hypothetical protein